MLTEQVFLTLTSGSPEENNWCMPLLYKPLSIPLRILQAQIAIKKYKTIKSALQDRIWRLFPNGRDDLPIMGFSFTLDKQDRVCSEILELNCWAIGDLDSMMKKQLAERPTWNSFSVIIYFHDLLILAPHFDDNTSFLEMSAVGLIEHQAQENTDASELLLSEIRDRTNGINNWAKQRLLEIKRK